MKNQIEELHLNKCYFFNVTINTEGGGFAGKLELSPQKIILTVMGEETENRHCTLSWVASEKLICHDFRNTFFLRDLKPLNGYKSSIGSRNNNISYFEFKYEVSSIIFIPSRLPEKDLFFSLHLHSETINQWIGNTNRQEEILVKYSQNDWMFDDHDFFVEFHTEIDDLGDLRTIYNTSVHSNSSGYTAGILFPPSISISFYRNKSHKDICDIYSNLYSLFSTLTGRDIQTDTIKLGYRHGYSVKQASFYLSQQEERTDDSRNHILFPLNKDIRYNHLGLPTLPLTLFNKYFQLDNKSISYFAKYIRYRRMSNVEERFLGYFRILESLCFKRKGYLDEDRLIQLSKRAIPFLIRYFGDKKNVESFISQLKRFNYSKYNTQNAYPTL